MLVRGEFQIPEEHSDLCKLETKFQIRVFLGHCTSLRAQYQLQDHRTPAPCLPLPRTGEETELGVEGLAQGSCSVGKHSSISLPLNFYLILFETEELATSPSEGDTMFQRIGPGKRLFPHHRRGSLKATRNFATPAPPLTMYVERKACQFLSPWRLCHL